MTNPGTSLLTDIASDIVELEHRVLRLVMGAQDISAAKKSALDELLLSLQKARHFLDDEAVAVMTHRRKSNAE